MKYLFYLIVLVTFTSCGEQKNNYSVEIATPKVRPVFSQHSFKSLAGSFSSEYARPIIGHSYKQHSYVYQNGFSVSGKNQDFAVISKEIFAYFDNYYLNSRIFFNGSGSSSSGKVLNSQRYINSERFIKIQIFKMPNDMVQVEHLEVLK